MSAICHNVCYDSNHRLSECRRRHGRRHGRGYGMLTSGREKNTVASMGYAGDGADGREMGRLTAGGSRGGGHPHGVCTSASGTLSFPGQIFEWMFVMVNVAAACTAEV